MHRTVHGVPMAVAVASVAGLLTLGAVVGALAHRQPPTTAAAGPRIVAPNASSSSRAFRVWGNVAKPRLYPGIRTRMRVYVQNFRPWAISVTRISVRVGSLVRGCSGTNLRIRTFRGHLRVSGWSRRRLRMRVRMLRSAPDACQAIRFSLRYSATASRS
jgi:hypothetical protein